MATPRKPGSHYAELAAITDATRAARAALVKVKMDIRNRALFRPEKSQALFADLTANVVGGVQLLPRTHLRDIQDALQAPDPAALDAIVDLWFAHATRPLREFIAEMGEPPDADENT